MVMPFKPLQFYGVKGIPRPWVHENVKFNDERVDPPVSPIDPLLSWAEEAHWSMGGLSFKRRRLQGRIEGNIQKLRNEREKAIKKRMDIVAAAAAVKRKAERSPSPPAAPVAIKRRRYIALADDGDDSEIECEDEERENVNSGMIIKRKLARKLGDDFEREALESGMGKRNASPATDGSGSVAKRTRSRRSEIEVGGDGVDVIIVEHVKKSTRKDKELKATFKKIVEDDASTPVRGSRTSPRLANRRMH